MYVRVTPMESDEQRDIGIENESKRSNGAVTFDRTGPTEKRWPPRKVDPIFRNFSVWTEPIHSVFVEWIPPHMYPEDPGIATSFPGTFPRPQTWDRCFVHSPPTVPKMASA